MENVSLLERLANPDLIQSMSMGDKVLASAYVAILGMVITFVALMILWGCIIVLSKYFGIKKPNKEVSEVKPKPAESKTVEPVKDEKDGDDEELIAVITAAVASSLNTTTHNIVVKNILRVEDQTPAWGKAGRSEQINTRL